MGISRWWVYGGAGDVVAWITKKGKGALNCAWLSYYEGVDHADGVEK